VIQITNTLSGKKEPFKPIEPHKIKMYVCGITPYDYAHVGHGRVAVVFDLLYRFLQFLDFEVTYCRNFTDIDDKLLKRAQQELGDQLKYAELAQKYIASYTEDVKALNCLKPDIEPRVTEVVPEIIQFIQSLIDSGYAYQSNGDVYFSIKAFPNYAKLSKHDVADLRAGERVQVSSIKKDPLDFVLWKGNDKGEFWESPWGYGRPGWHIECSVMASKFLGKQIDIHGGGMDLVFPHHDNEIAQSEALHKKPFANYWMHNAFVRINKEKMSKSLGNFFTLRDVFKKFDPMVVRFYYLKHQYRAPLDFSFDDMLAVQKSYRRLCKFFQDNSCNQKVSRAQMNESPIIRKMVSFLADDLNSPGMLGVLFESLDELKKDDVQRCAVKLFIQSVLGLTLEPLSEKKVEVTPEIQELIDERVQARAEKNWARADELREKLKELGVEVQDKKL